MLEGEIAGMNASIFDAADRGLEVLDVALQERVALVGDRPGADHAVLPGADVTLRVEFRERQRLARARPRTAVAVLLVDLEAAQPLVDVGDEARLGVFAVVDDIDAELDLLLHDLLHRAGQPRRAPGLVDGLALLLGREHVQEIGRAGQGAGVGGENALG